MRRLTFMTMRCIKLLHTSYLVCNFFIDKKDLINLLLTPLFIISKQTTKNHSIQSGFYL